MKVAQRYFNRGNSKIISKDYAGAITYFDKGIENNPKFAWAYLNRGIAKNFSIENNESPIHFTGNMEIDQADSCSDYNPGFLTLFRSQISNLVLADFDKAIELNPWFSKAYFSRGMVKSGLDNHSMGFVDHEKYMLNGLNNEKSFPGNVTRQNYRQEDHSDVMADFDRAIEIDPEFAQAYYTRGITKNYYQKKHDITVELITANENDPNLIGTLFGHQELTSTRKKDFSGAISDFDKAIEINPDYADAYYYRGLAKNYLQNNTDGVSDFSRISADKDQYVTNSEEKRSLSKEPPKDYQSVLADFDMAIKINPKHAKAYCSRGLVKFFCEYQWEGISDYFGSKVTQCDAPNNFDCRNRSRDYNIKNYTGALADFDKAIEINPRFAIAYYYRSIAKFYCNDHAGATIDCERAKEIDPEHSEDYYKNILSKGYPENTKRGYLN